MVEQRFYFPAKISGVSFSWQNIVTAFRELHVSTAIAMHDYPESVTTGQTDRQIHGQTDAGQSDPYLPLCFAVDQKYVCTLWS